MKGIIGFWQRQNLSGRPVCLNDRLLGNRRGRQEDREKEGEEWKAHECPQKAAIPADCISADKEKQENAPGRKAAIIHCRNVTFPDF